MERKLASVQRVLDILPIDGADAIELVKINGWQCVTKKGEFRPGDLGVFFEIDSIPPDLEQLRFLWTSRNAPAGTLSPRPDKFRIRTMKLRGTLSQGLFMPLPVFGISGAEAGQDLTEYLGVGKYEPPAPANMGEAAGRFPAFLSKTDEIRVQSVPEVLDELRGKPFVATLKYDGSSATFCVDPFTDEFLVCSRNLTVAEGDNLFWEVARKHDVASILLREAERGRKLAIQGEVFGPGIQKNRLGVKEKSLAVFNVFDISGGRFLDHDEAREWLDSNGLPAVQEVERGESFAHTQDSLLELAEGKYPGTTNEREGIVIRPLTERHSQVLKGRLSFKAISNRFLLKEDG